MGLEDGHQPFQWLHSVPLFARTTACLSRHLLSEYPPCPLSNPRNQLAVNIFVWMPSKQMCIVLRGDTVAPKQVHIITPSTHRHSHPDNGQSLSVPVGLGGTQLWSMLRSVRQEEGLRQESEASLNSRARLCLKKRKECPAYLGLFLCRASPFESQLLGCGSGRSYGCCSLLIH